MLVKAATDHYGLCVSRSALKHRIFTNQTHSLSFISFFPNHRYFRHMFSKLIISQHSHRFESLCHTLDIMICQIAWDWLKLIWVKHDIFDNGSTILYFNVWKSYNEMCVLVQDAVSVFIMSYIPSSKTLCKKYAFMIPFTTDFGQFHCGF